MINYAYLARKHAREALSKFLDNKNAFIERCTGNEISISDEKCIKCLTEKVMDILHSIKFRENTSSASTFHLTPDTEDERIYDDAALKLITRVVINSFKNTPDSVSLDEQVLITNPEKAYDKGLANINEVLEEISSALSPNDYVGDMDNVVKDKAIEKLQNVHPNVHSAIIEYYNKGVEHGLTSFTLPPPKMLESLITSGKQRTFQKKYRIERYKKCYNNC